MTLSFADPSRTLTDADVDAVISSILQALQSDHEAALRT